MTPRLEDMLSRGYCELAAEKHTSWFPEPRGALLAALANNGHDVRETLEPLTKSGFNWCENKRMAKQEKLDRMFTIHRSKRERQRVEGYADALRLGISRGDHQVCAYTEAQVAAMQWYAKRERQRPIEVLFAVSSDGYAASVDIRERYNALQDRSAITACANLFQSGCRAAGIDLGAFLKGEAITVRSSQLGSFAAWLKTEAMACQKLLALRAPGTSPKALANASRKAARLRAKRTPTISDVIDHGAMLTFRTLLSRVGGERVGKPKRVTERGLGRVSVAVFQLSRFALEARQRAIPKWEIWMAELDPVRFRRTPEHIVGGAAPFAVDVRAYKAVPSSSMDANEVDPYDADKRARQQRVLSDLDARIAADGPAGDFVRVRASRVHRPNGTRLYVSGPDLQSVPRRCRGAFRPAGSDQVFVSVDMRAAQPAVLAGRTHDPGLTQLALVGYEGLAEKLFPLRPAREARERTKEALVAWLNGGGHRVVHHYLADPRAERNFRRWLEDECPRFEAFRAEAKRAWDAAGIGEVVEIATPDGSRVMVERTDGKGVGTLLSAAYTSTEADILDTLLLNLPQRSQLVIPMFDGLLVSCARADAARVAEELGKAMLAAARDRGVQVRCKVGVGDSWGQAEESAAIFEPPRGEEEREAA